MKVYLETGTLKRHNNRGIGVYAQNLKKYLETKTAIELVGQPEKADIIHYPFFDFFFLTLPWIKTKPTVVTVHDVVPLIYPEHFPPGIKGKLKFLIQKQLLSRVEAIITDSNTSAKDLSTYLNIPTNKVNPIYLGAPENFNQPSLDQVKVFKEKHNLPPKFFGFVGAVSYNKNLARLIQAVDRLGKYPLIIVTNTEIDSKTQEKQTRMVLDSVQSALAALKHKDLVQFIKIKDHKDLNVFYASCLAYVQPSLYEGFGLPVVEAMKSGTLVVVSQGGALGELVGKSPYVFDPLNISDMVGVLEQAVSLTSSEKKVTIEANLLRVQKFNWQETAEQTINVYAKVLSKIT